MDRNKVKFGISNAYYAIGHMAGDGSATYETPVQVPGSVNLNIAPEGELTPFYADNIVYYQSGGNAGYSANWEVAKVPDQFWIDVFKSIRDANGVLIENADAEPAMIALLFEMDGDIHKRRHVLYNCTPTRPEANASTHTDTKTPITDTIPLSCKSVYNPALDINTPKATVEQGDAAYASWFDAVYQSSGETEAPSENTEDTTEDTTQEP